MKFGSTDRGTVDIGQWELPRHRTVTLRVVGPDKTPLSGSIRVQLAAAKLGGSATRIGSTGLATCPDVAFDQRYIAEVHTVLPDWGPTVLKTSLPVTGTETTLYVTGAGMLIVRFQTADSQPRPAQVLSPTVVWKGKRTMRSVAFSGKAQEVRLWVGRGDEGHVECHGVLTAGRSETVLMKGDRPTIVAVSINSR